MVTIPGFRQAALGFKEEFVKRGTNAATLSAGSSLVIEYRSEAERNDNLPHNAFTIGNQDTTSTLYIFLDLKEDEENPDYIVFPNQQITVGLEDGASFTHIFVKNTHATHDVAANAIKHRISTIKAQNA